MTLGHLLLSLPFFLGGGIIAGWYLCRRLDLALFAGVLTLFLVFRFAKERRKALGLLGFLFLGFLLGASEGRVQTHHRQIFHAYRGQPVSLLGTVLETPAPWRNGVRFLLRVEELAGEKLTVQPRLEVFLSQVADYDYGQRLALRGRFFGDEVKPGSAWARERVVGGLSVAGEVKEQGRGQVSPLGRWVNICQRKLLAVGKATLPPPEATILHGMLLGRREPALSTYTFERVGVAHLLSVSGLHLTFWLGLFWGLGKIFHLPDRVLGLLAIPVVTLFVLVAGGGAPALRAGTMTLLALFGELTQRRSRGPLLLAVAAAVILVLRPLDGFALFLAACAGLIIVYPAGRALAVYPGLRKRAPSSSLAQLMVARFWPNFTAEYR